MSSTKIIEEVKTPKDESSNQVSNKNSYLYFRMRFSHECTLIAAWWMNCMVKQEISDFLLKSN